MLDTKKRGEFMLLRHFCRVFNSSGLKIQTALFFWDKKLYLNKKMTQMRMTQINPPPHPSPFRKGGG